jgi:hypothetical protein
MVVLREGGFGPASFPLAFVARASLDAALTIFFSMS